VTELREVFEMITRNTEPDRDAWEEQERRQRRAARTRKLGAIGLVAALMVAGIVFAVTRDDGTTVQQPAEPVPSASGDGTPGAQPLGVAIVGLDGSVQELGLPTDAWMPDLSADGTRVVFLSGSVHLGFCGGCSADDPLRDRLADVRVGEPSGRFIYLENVGHLSSVQQPVWSPDADRIAFVGIGDDGNSDIYVADTTPHRGVVLETRAQRLTTDPAVDEFPAWTQDGSTIVYDNGGASPLDDSGFSLSQEIWSVPADGGTPERLTNNDTNDGQADVAADGTIAFRHGEDIWTMDLDGGHQAPLDAVPAGLGFTPRWSPDGSMLALLRYDPSERATFDLRRGRPADLPLLDVVVVDLDTGAVTAVGPRVAADFNPVSWTPDSSALLIDRYDDGG
jgi:dipeptidyl aminopeptidase/acylaminoacyl peptidase